MMGREKTAPRPSDHHGHHHFIQLLRCSDFKNDLARQNLNTMLSKTLKSRILELIKDGYSAYQECLNELREFLATGLIQRSIFLSSLGMHSEIIEDLEYAVERTNFSGECIDLLNFTTGTFYDALGNNEMRDRAEHPIFSSALKILDDPSDKILVAARDISIGDVLCVENPISYGMFMCTDTDLSSSGNAWLYCTECFKMCFYLRPCSKCSWINYCSDQCEKVAWDKYHKGECANMNAYIALFKSTLVFNTLAMISAGFPKSTACMEKFVNFFMDEALPKAYALLEDCVTPVYFHDTGVISFEKRGWGIYKSSSFFEKTCDGNVLSTFYQKTRVIRAVKPIKKGEKLTMRPNWRVQVKNIFTQISRSEIIEVAISLHVFVRSTKINDVPVAGNLDVFVQSSDKDLGVADVEHYLIVSFDQCPS
ncbi:Hypothetical predicted protein [Cloeon dipterum]|uniref:MYND-type domain-containing protein n=1 Tax=Cloeon dipterum TaxID=197152 RepID=A0A8S1CD84_9INSE|nr:Hypothetical predicted protein [Cloeon dipterum]